ncbi:GNAT family N-acetyltransferase [Mycoplasma marinum]|uniref:N-acetyltransferase domain-containing protein n=1 Tax=Mycoplasma marinum TaxID=1937190 RepID=A0A4R0XT67_9MOLU|nr:GNAT family N-acetyltransferase [Mycoplasma marinum]TCG10937.1 hypothetical protein C4B24_03440 [Mycoplasma marinum]
MENNLSLRPLMKDDWKGMFEYGSDKETMKFLYHDYYKTEQDAKEHNSILMNESNQSYAIIYCGKMIGVTSLKGITTTKLYIGYVLNKKYWGKGLGTKTLELILDIAKQKHSEKIFYAIIYKKNIASMKILEKAGFTRSEEVIDEAFVYTLKNNLK